MHPILKYILANEVYHNNYPDFEVEMCCLGPTPGSNVLTFDKKVLIYDKRWLEALVYYVYNDQWINDHNPQLKTDEEIFALAATLKKTSQIELVQTPSFEIQYFYPLYL